MVVIIGEPYVSHSWSPRRVWSTTLLGKEWVSRKYVALRGGGGLW